MSKPTDFYDYRVDPDGPVAWRGLSGYLPSVTEALDTLRQMQSSGESVEASYTWWRQAWQDGSAQAATAYTRETGEWARSVQG